MLRFGRFLIWVAAAAFLLLGLAAFVAPDWGSGNFPWKAGPFFTMTAGGWAIGTGLIAADVARDPQAQRIYPFVVYLVMFTLGQLAVVVLFFDRFLAGHVLAWPYLVGLVSALAGSVLLAIGWRPLWPDRVLGPLTADGRSAVPAWGRAAALLFAAFVGLLALGTLVAGPNGTVAHGNVFPEALTLFSIRAFCTFLFALACAAASLAVARQALPYIELARAGLYLIVPTTLAALVHIEQFDTARPGTLFYLVTYVAVGVLLAAVLWTQRDARALAAEPQAR